MDLKPVDSYALRDRNVDRSLVEKYGVALGMDTNNGTVWLQQPGQNLIPQKDIY